MTNKNSTYRRLGDYIREISVRNKDLSVSKLMGINIDKYFMPSVANVIGTDMSNYKVVANGQFACNLMHVGRDEKIPVALNTEDPIIVSPAYFVFEVCDNTLLPEYLELSLRNPEFDRNAWFHTDGDVRGGMDKEGMKDLLIPVPSLEEQRSIVSRYKAIETRISNNKQTIAKLEEAAQALYRKMFVDDVDVENLPDGWRMGCLGEVAEIKNGKNITFDENGYISVYGGNGIVGKVKIHNAENVIVIGRVGVNCGSLHLHIGTCWVNDNAMMAKSKFVYYLYFLMQQFKLNEQSEGSSQPLLTQGILNSQNCFIPTEDKMEDFNLKAEIIFDSIKGKQKENEKLTEMLSMMA